MNDEQVFRLVMETNPVPDPDGLDSPIALAELERGSRTMAIDSQVRTESIEPNNSRSWQWGRGPLVGGALAILVLVVGIGAWVLTADDQDVADGPEVSVVMAAYDAMNNDDIDGWFATLSESRAAAESRDDRQFLVNMSARTELIEACRMLEPSPTSGLARVQCRVTVSNDYHDPGGIDLTRTDTFLIDDAGKIDNVIEQWEYDDVVFFAYNEDFSDWLESAYPDVLADINPGGSQFVPGWRGDPADMLTAVEYIDEFVAQSDKYPLDGGN